MEESIARRISEEFRVPLKLAQAMVKRGIETLPLAKITFEPEFENLIPPESLPDIRLALQIIKESLLDGDLILIWGHEDTDGATSVSIIKRALLSLGVEARYYIPSKDTEGHGLYREGIDKLLGWGVKTLITVDCCGTDREVVNYARARGMKVVVTDHHEIRPKVLPDPPVVNPKVGGGSFPFLAGAGVALKIAWALLQDQLNWSLTHFASALPECVIWAALGTMADRVPLYAENRAIVSKGEQLYTRWQHPVKEVFREAEGREPTFLDLMYLLSAARSSYGINRGVDLLLSRSREETRTLLMPLWEHMRNWSQQVEKIMKPVLEGIQGVRDYILVDLRDSPPRLLGYVASRLKEQFNVPVIVLGRRGKSHVVAEVRAPKGFDSLALLNHLGDLLLNYGGHKPASGFSMDASLLPALIEEVEAYFRSLREREEPSREVDLTLEEGDLNPDLVRGLLRLADLGLLLSVRVPVSDLPRIRDSIIPGCREIKSRKSVVLEATREGFRVLV